MRAGHVKESRFFAFSSPASAATPKRAGGAGAGRRGSAQEHPGLGSIPAPGASWPQEHPNPRSEPARRGRSQRAGAARLKPPSGHGEGPEVKSAAPGAWALPKFSLFLEVRDAIWERCGQKSSCASRRRPRPKETLACSHGGLLWLQNEKDKHIWQRVGRVSPQAHEGTSPVATCFCQIKKPGGRSLWQPRP